MIKALLYISIILYILSATGYILAVAREKYYLKNNIVFIENKNVDPEHIKELDVKHFMLGSKEIMAGDEVKILLNNEVCIRGTVLGGNKSENSIAILTDDDAVRRFRVSSIKKLKIISKYGKFFNFL